MRCPWLLDVVGDDDDAENAGAVYASVSRPIDIEGSKISTKLSRSNRQTNQWKESKRILEYKQRFGERSADDVDLRETGDAMKTNNATRKTTIIKN